jgi:hypothetical protein
MTSCLNFNINDDRCGRQVHYSAVSKREAWTLTQHSAAGDQGSADVCQTTNHANSNMES